MHVHLRVPKSWDRKRCMMHVSCLAFMGKPSRFIEFIFLYVFLKIAMIKTLSIVHVHLRVPKKWDRKSCIMHVSCLAFMGKPSRFIEFIFLYVFLKIAMIKTLNVMHVHLRVPKKRDRKRRMVHVSCLAFMGKPSRFIEFIFLYVFLKIAMIKTLNVMHVHLRVPKSWKRKVA